MIKRFITVVVFSILCFVSAKGQSFRIEDVKDLFGKGKPLKLTGGFSANSTVNASNAPSGRESFVYYLNGNINLNLYGLVDLPFSFSLTNSGSSYKLPSSPNRLSIHPSYKWITGHIGDVSMTFSPYTLNGHIFTGAGVEMTPDGWELAAMYGRLQKAVAYDEVSPSFLPTYKRTGYGFKVGRVGKKYQLSANLFRAGDDINSLVLAPDSLGVTPMENLAGSLSFLFKPVEFIEIKGEYGVSTLQTDRRAEANDAVTYHAFKTELNYVGKTNRFGVGYERIDPGYRSLGAYYFRNDLENITLNAYQSFWENKINLTLSIGYEHDDLKKTKATASSRVVGSGSLAVSLSERLNANLSYSNFQTYTNIRSAFEELNKENPLDKLDTLNFVQLSQSANLNLNIITKKTEAQLHNLNLNFSYQDAANKQGGAYQPGSVTEMINAVSTYSCTFLKTGLTLNGALNMNNSRILNGNNFTWGPTLGASSRLFRKKVMLGGSLSYNTGSLKGIKQNEVFLCRLNSSYAPWARHNFTLSYSYQWRSVLDRDPVNNSLLTAGYSYSF